MPTEIEWTHEYDAHGNVVAKGETWNPVRGCSKVSEGCRNCYAMKQAHRFSGEGQPYEGLTKVVPGKGPQWTGKVMLVHDALDKPLRWRKPRKVFVNSMSDLFHPDVPDGFVAQVFAIMAAAHRHTFQVLTKRPERMAALLNSDAFWGAVWMHGMEQFWSTEDLARIDELGPPWPLPNVWLGTSVEDQPAADERIPHLLRCPAAVRFLSCEPLLGPVDIGWCSWCGRFGPHDCESGYPWEARLDDGVDLAEAGVDWIIAGGESGQGARPCDVAWIRSLVRQCQAAGVPAFVKQLGADPCEIIPGVGPVLSSVNFLGLRDRKGGDPSEWPEDIRVREFPTPPTPTPKGAARG